MCDNVIGLRRRTSERRSRKRRSLSLPGQAECGFVTCSGFVVGAQTTQHVSASCVQQVIVVKFACCSEFVDQVERLLRTFGHSDRQQRGLTTRSATASTVRADRTVLTICVQLVSSGRAALQCSAAIAASSANGPGCTTKCFVDQRQRFVDLWSIPKRAILLFEHNQITVFIKSSLAPGVV